MKSEAPGVMDFGDGLLGYFQPNGSWGLANAGLVCSSGHALLIDTLFDRRRTAEMLAAFRSAAGIEVIEIIINTHANGDHCWGNGLLPAAEIIATEAAAREMTGHSPSGLAQLISSFPQGSVCDRYVRGIFGVFDFDDCEPRLPTRTFTGALSLLVGGERIELVEVGPAHTSGDLIVYVPDKKAVFTGDIVFVDSHPVVWSGPLANWIAACEYIAGLAPQVVIPGHGPWATTREVLLVRDYLRFVDREARARHQAGMSAAEAARDIAFDEFRHWRDAERVIVNVDAVYREIEGRGGPDYFELTGEMAELAAEWGLHGLKAPGHACRSVRNVS